MEREAKRTIMHRTQGMQKGPIKRLMSPSDLGQIVKPFVFLDIFEAKGQAIQMVKEMPIHPHSGIATVTVFTEGAMLFDDPTSGKGEVGEGGVEFLRAGNGVWHGKEMVPASVSSLQGVQLWYALSPELENSEPISRYISTGGLPKKGAVQVVVGEYDGMKSPLPDNDKINYLIVTLHPGEKWTYHPPAGHTVGWLALAKGELDVGEGVIEGEIAIFNESGNSIVVESTGTENAVFVLGSAIPHPHPLHLGTYSVHTSAEALAKGEARIRDLGIELMQAGDRHTDQGSTPVFK